MKLSDAPVTVAIAAATLACSGLLILSGALPLATLGAGFIPLRLLSGAAVPGHAFLVPAWLTPLSATLIHAGPAHLILNLVTFAYCGMAAERAVGGKGIAILYLVGAYAAAAGQWLFNPASPLPMIGASGAISAVVAAYALLYAQRRAKKIGPVPARTVHALWLAAAWIGIQALVGIAGMGGVTVAIGAHIGGFLAGLVLARPLLLWRYRTA